MIRFRVAVVVIGVLATLLAACSTGDVGTTDASRTAASSPFATCPDAATPTGSPTPSGSAGARTLPSIVLPCFTGGGSVNLARLGRPMVINFWASTCSPCRQEMPQFQRFAGEVSGRLLVIGVDTADARDAAAAAGADFGTTYPVLFDPQSKLLSAWGLQVLPVTLFVDQFGIVRGQDMSGALTVAKLTELAGRYLGTTP